MYREVLRSGTVKEIWRNQGNVLTRAKIIRSLAKPMLHNESPSDWVKLKWIATKELLGENIDLDRAWKLFWVENGRLKDEFYGRKKKSEMILDILNWVDGKSVRRGYLADRTINAEQNLENFKTFQKMIFNPCTEFQFKEIAEKRLQNLDKKLFVLDTNFLITHSNQLDQLCDEGIVIVPQISQYELALEYEASFSEVELKFNKGEYARKQLVKLYSSKK